MVPESTLCASCHLLPLFGCSPTDTMKCSCFCCQSHPHCIAPRFVRELGDSLVLQALKQMRPHAFFRPVAFGWVTFSTKLKCIGYCIESTVFSVSLWPDIYQLDLYVVSVHTRQLRYQLLDISSQHQHAVVHSYSRRWTPIYWYHNPVVVVDMEDLSEVTVILIWSHVQGVLPEISF